MKLVLRKDDGLQPQQNKGCTLSSEETPCRTSPCWGEEGSLEQFGLWDSFGAGHLCGCRAGLTVLGPGLSFSFASSEAKRTLQSSSHAWAPVQQYPRKSRRDAHTPRAQRISSTRHFSFPGIAQSSPKFNTILLLLKEDLKQTSKASQ